MFLPILVEIPLKMKPINTPTKETMSKEPMDKDVVSAAFLVVISLWFPDKHVLKMFQIKS